MSISGSMSSALSGLTAAARSAELISSNIANALTEGYGRRELEVTARRLGNTGQGVKIVGVSREINQALVADRRIADANAASTAQQSNFFTRLETVLGSPTESSSLSGKFANFDSALIAASAEPESSVRQSNVVEAARGLASHFRTASKEVQTMREEADKRIATQVSVVNRALAAIADLNQNISSSAGAGRDPSALLDQRQQLIDQISSIIPIREIPRENGRIALYSAGGASLLEGKPAILGFSAVGVIAPDMTLGSGALSGLTLNGHPVSTGATGPLAGGALIADFTIRDQLAPRAQSELDSLARDLIFRFQDPALDPTLTAADAGLFTDSSSAFLTANEDGIAIRIGLNTAVDPSAAGQLWRIRDGLGAVTAGPAGQSALFSAMQSALNDPRPIASGQFAGDDRDVLSLSSNLVSVVTNNRVQLEVEAGFSAARATALQSLELQGGVDTDRELQDLLLVEQAYAANAKVIQTADDMLKILLGM
ncbi:flagellar hook-associated protein FlgK [Pseudorhodobacter sp.]|uniref:flagellar hook-associated protein FlgK n=1 Tax=Pseudorhodobacter sp. TaxID=1934400 RepID=UPI002AFE973A|nr:flagellar hook-associated protein FlgK [Pseudorhodobacter sp.]